MDNINSGITNAGYLVILVTKNSNKSWWIKYEISTAIDLERKNKGPIHEHLVHIVYKLMGMLNSSVDLPAQVLV